MAAVECRGMVVFGGSGRMCAYFFAGGIESGGIRIWERGYSTVVFVAGSGIVEGAFAEAGGEVTEELVRVSFGLTATAALDAGDGGWVGEAGREERNPRGESWRILPRAAYISNRSAGCRLRFRLGCVLCRHEHRYRSRLTRKGVEARRRSADMGRCPR